MTGKSTCGSTSLIFNDYVNYFNSLILSYILPICVSILFSVLAYRNVQQLRYRSVPLVRRELEKQLTKMVLLQVLMNLFALTPHLIITILQIIPIITDESILAQIRFVSNITVHLYYSYYAVNIYC